MRCAIARPVGGRVVRFALHIRNDNQQRTPPLERLKAACGPGDQGEPVVTVMLPEERLTTTAGQGRGTPAFLDQGRTFPLQAVLFATTIGAIGSAG